MAARPKATVTTVPDGMLAPTTANKRSRPASGQARVLATHQSSATPTADAAYSRAPGPAENLQRLRAMDPAQKYTTRQVRAVSPRTFFQNRDTIMSPSTWYGRVVSGGAASRHVTSTGGALKVTVFDLLRQSEQVFRTVDVFSQSVLQDSSEGPATVTAFSKKISAGCGVHLTTSGPCLVHEVVCYSGRRSLVRPSVNVRAGI